MCKFPRRATKCFCLRWWLPELGLVGEMCLAWPGTSSKMAGVKGLTLVDGVEKWITGNFISGCWWLNRVLGEGYVTGECILEGCLVFGSSSLALLLPAAMRWTTLLWHTFPSHHRVLLHHKPTAMGHLWTETWNHEPKEVFSSGILSQQWEVTVPSPSIGTHCAQMGICPELKQCLSQSWNWCCTWDPAVAPLLWRGDVVWPQVVCVSELKPWPLQC